MTLEIGVILPTSSPDPDEPIIGDVQASARFAESVGLDSVWSTDHVLAVAPILDSGTVLATAAGATERIRIGYNVMLLALRPAAWAAKQISTLQHVSGGRLTLGIGTGNPMHGDLGWRAVGASYEDRGRRTDEALRVLPGLITGKPTELADGLEVTLAPGTAMPPVLIAGNGKAALRRAAAYGDGWISLGLPPADVATAAAELATLAAERERPAPAPTVVVPALDSHPEKAAEQLRSYVEVGTERVIIAPTGPDWKRDYEYAAEVRSRI